MTRGGVKRYRSHLEAGANVVATARSLSQVEAAFAAAPGFSGRLLPVALDVLVNNAGRGLLGAVEEASAAEVEAAFATNVFGLLNLTRAVLPHMRAAHCGHVVNISSMGGFAQVAGWGVYGATKFAVEGLSEAMQAELAPLGIRVTIVEPGSFRTSFLDDSSLHTAANELPDYATRVRDELEAWRPLASSTLFTGTADPESA
jgi:NAD(P)-dependent dehydrogenase (short-subunit alcohol dehydrogenase family)